MTTGLIRLSPGLEPEPVKKFTGVEVPVWYWGLMLIDTLCGYAFSYAWVFVGVKPE